MYFCSFVLHTFYYLFTVASSTEARAYRARLAYQNVNCSGNEAGLSDCPHSLVGSISECGSGSIARVQCQGTLTRVMR